MTSLLIKSYEEHEDNSQDYSPPFETESQHDPSFTGSFIRTFGSLGSDTTPRLSGGNLIKIRLSNLDKHSF